METTTLQSFLDRRKMKIKFSCITCEDFFVENDKIIYSFTSSPYRVKNVLCLSHSKNTQQTGFKQRTSEKLINVCCSGAKLDRLRLKKCLPKTVSLASDYLKKVYIIQMDSEYGTAVVIPSLLYRSCLDVVLPSKSCKCSSLTLTKFE